MTTTDLADVDKLAGSDLQAFATADHGTRPVVVELATVGPLATPPLFHRPPPAHLLRPPATPPADDSARMDALEDQLKALLSDTRPTRVDVARAFFVVVTPATLRAMTRLPQVGVIRPRQHVTTAG